MRTPWLQVGKSTHQEELLQALPCRGKAYGLPSPTSAPSPLASPALAPTLPAPIRRGSGAASLVRPLGAPPDVSEGMGATCKGLPVMPAAPTARLWTQAAEAPAEVRGGDAGGGLQFAVPFMCTLAKVPCHASNLALSVILSSSRSRMRVSESDSCDWQDGLGQSSKGE